MDDLRVAQSAALSGLTASEAQTSVVSANIANANVDGYTAKITNLATTLTGGKATGVGLAAISTYVDDNLVRSLMSATSDENYTQTLSDALGTLSSAVGSTDSETTIADCLTSLQTALENLTVTPESDSLKYTAVDDAASTAESLNSLSSEVQQQRSDADQQIASSVDDLNQALETIDSLNSAIVKAKALGQETADLEDQRREALKTVAGELDVNYFVTSSGEMQVYTSSGQPLVDSKAHTLAYKAAGSVSATTSFNDITLDGKAVTTSLNGGEIGALLTLRDDTLPTVQDELDALASTLIDQANTVSNQGTAVPAPQTLTGTASVSATDSLSATGTMRIALVDSDGTVSSVTDLDLSSYSTNQDLVDAINGISGVSASIDSDGHLVISADDSSLGVAVNEMDSAVGSDGVGISSYFGLNDLFTGTSASDIAVRSDLADDSTLLPTATLSSSSSLAAGDTGITSGDGSIAENLESLLSGTVDVPAAGSLSESKTTLADYAASIISDVATKASSASTKADTAASVADNLSTSLSNEAGVNVDDETAKLTALENQYSACSKVFDIIDQMFQSLLDAIG